MGDQEINERADLVQIGAAVEEGLTKAMNIAKAYASQEEDDRIVKFVAECIGKWKLFQENYKKLAFAYAALRHLPNDALYDCLCKMQQAVAEERAGFMANHRYDGLMGMDM